MGIILNFTERTVQGFGDPGLIDIPAKITAANDVTVAFAGSAHPQIPPDLEMTISGTLDRVTGDVYATMIGTDRRTQKH